jgi:hypothetical protein
LEHKVAKSYEVLSFLRPDGGYRQVGTDYEGITFEPQCEPFTREEYQAGFAQYDALKAEQEADKAAAKAAAQAKLAALGLTVGDLQALGL